jgi:hypothetical protein
MKSIRRSFTLKPNTLANRLLIQVLAQSLGGAATEWPISAIRAEKSGGEWYLWIHQANRLPLQWLAFAAKGITINGKSLDRFLEEVWMDCYPTSPPQQ